MFIHPEGQYWYLYALFFLFFITPTFKNKNAAVIALILSFLMKVLGFFTDGMLSSILSNEIWFVIGMCMSVFEFKKITVRKNLPYSIILGIIFVLLSIVIYAAGIQNRLIGFILGLAACFSIVMMIAIIYEHRGQSKLFGILAKYTMPIFLMHTMFAAGLRAALFKLGIYNSAIHIILGISISFIGPIIAAVIMKKLKFLEFFLYPGKFIKIDKIFSESKH
ncbi:MAG: hypothetical protein LUG21_04375 [Clostridiales bacterium]|nr:hypothetical protein [Clostridiales bacterium]